MTFNFEIVKEFLKYDSESGKFTWAINYNNRKVYSEAGSITNSGYNIITIRNTRILAHRLAWFFEHGEMPRGDIDHINGDRLDNRICNLRDVHRSVNSENQRRPHITNTSGYMGVCWHKRKSKWCAGISLKGKSIHIGYFNDPKDAHEAYLTKKREIHEGCTI